MSLFHTCIQKISYLYDLLLQYIQKIQDYLPSPRHHILPPISPRVSQSAKKESQSVFSFGQITVFWFVGLAVVYLGYLMFQSLDLLYLIISAFLISLAMESLIGLAQHRMKRGIAIAVSYILFLLFLLLGSVVIVPFVLQQLSSTTSVLIAYFYDMQLQIARFGLDAYIQSLSWLPQFAKSYLLQSLATGTSNIQSMVLSNLASLVSTGSDYAKELGSFAFALLGSLMSFLGQIGLVLTIAVFFSIEKDPVISFLTTHLAPKNQSSYLAYKIDILYVKMGLWLKSQLGLCLYIAIIVYAVLWILGGFGIDLPNKGALALMAGFTEFIPYVGPILGGIPAIIVATSVYGINGFIIVSIAYIVIQWTENNILIPILMNKSLGVSPLLIFLCMLLGSSVLGFMGIVLAVPFAVIVTLLFDRDFE